MVSATKRWAVLIASFAIVAAGLHFYCGQSGEAEGVFCGDLVEDRLSNFGLTWKCEGPKEVEVCKKNKRKCTTILEEANKTCIWSGAGGRTSESEAPVQEKNNNNRKRLSFRDCLDGFVKRVSGVGNLQVQNFHPPFQASLAEAMGSAWAPSGGLFPGGVALTAFSVVSVAAAAISVVVVRRRDARSARGLDGLAVELRDGPGLVVIA